MGRKKFLVFGGALLFLLCTLSGMSAAFTPGSVQVKVHDFYTDEPITGVQVLMTPGNYKVTTGSDGDPGTDDDVLNIAVCQTCHQGLTTFDRNGVQTENRRKVQHLGELLKAENHGFILPFQPGKCATYHRCSNLPFIDDDDEETFRHAYLNYSLIVNDRSFGIHNLGYIKRLLDDSIAALEGFKKKTARID